MWLIKNIHVCKKVELKNYPENLLSWVSTHWQYNNDLSSEKASKG